MHDLKASADKLRADADTADPNLLAINEGKGLEFDNNAYGEVAAGASVSDLSALYRDANNDTTSAAGVTYKYDDGTSATVGVDPALVGLSAKSTEVSRPSAPKDSIPEPTGAIGVLAGAWLLGRRRHRLAR